MADEAVGSSSSSTFALVVLRMKTTRGELISNVVSASASQADSMTNDSKRVSPSRWIRSRWASENKAAVKGTGISHSAL